MSKKTTIEFNSLSHIVIIKPRAIGDVLLSTPVVENLKSHFLHLAIDFLTENYAADVVCSNPFVNEVITYSKKNDSTLSIVKKIRSKKYDAVIDLFGNPRTALITKFSGAKYRIGFPFRGRAYAYNIHVPPRGGEVHNVDFNLDVLRYLQIPIVTRNPLFPLTKEDMVFAEVWLKEIELYQKSIIGINASGGWYTKKWGIEHFAQLADSIIAKYNCEILLFWGPGEETEVERMRATMRHGAHLIPKTTLKQMGALFTYCKAVISNDSGPMHIAASLNIPTLGIFGPTNPKLQGPFGEKNRVVVKENLDCLGCNLTSCTIGNICMKELSVEKVFMAFQKLIEENKVF